MQRHKCHGKAFEDLFSWLEEHYHNVIIHTPSNALTIQICGQRLSLEATLLIVYHYIPKPAVESMIDDVCGSESSPSLGIPHQAFLIALDAAISLNISVPRSFHVDSRHSVVVDSMLLPCCRTVRPTFGGEGRCWVFDWRER